MPSANNAPSAAAPPEFPARYMAKRRDVKQRVHSAKVAGVKAASDLDKRQSRALVMETLDMLELLDAESRQYGYDRNVAVLWVELTSAAMGCIEHEQQEFALSVLFRCVEQKKRYLDSAPGACDASSQHVARGDVILSAAGWRTIGKGLARVDSAAAVALLNDLVTDAALSERAWRDIVHGVVCGMCFSGKVEDAMYVLSNMLPRKSGPQQSKLTVADVNVVLHNMPSVSVLRASDEGKARENMRKVQFVVHHELVRASAVKLNTLSYEFVFRLVASTEELVWEMCEDMLHETRVRPSNGLFIQLLKFFQKCGSIERAQLLVQRWAPVMPCRSQGDGDAQHALMDAASGLKNALEPDDIAWYQVMLVLVGGARIGGGHTPGTDIAEANLAQVRELFDYFTAPGGPYCKHAELRSRRVLLHNNFMKNGERKKVNRVIEDGDVWLFAPHRCLFRALALRAQVCLAETGSKHDETRRTAERECREIQHELRDMLEEHSYIVLLSQDAVVVRGALKRLDKVFG
jgi:hypothetical protein